jgi:hypothetical protein
MHEYTLRRVWASIVTHLVEDVDSRQVVRFANSIIINIMAWCYLQCTCAELSVYISVSNHWDLTPLYRHCYCLYGIVFVISSSDGLMIRGSPHCLPTIISSVFMKLWEGARQHWSNEDYFSMRMCATGTALCAYRLNKTLINEHHDGPTHW